MRLEDSSYEAWITTSSDESLYNLQRAVIKQAMGIVYLILRQDRKDIAGEAAARVIMELSQFNRKSKFSTWSHRIIKNYVFDIKRQMVAKKEVEIEESLSYQGDTGYDKVLRDDIIKQFSGKEQTILKMKLDGYTGEEIAQMTELSTGGVKMRWKRIQEQIKTLLSR